MPTSSAAPGLARYRARRDFEVTPEPAAGDRRRAGPRAASEAAAPPRFVIQKHWASRLHYDLRLQIGDVLVSWAVPKGPSFDPADKRMAMHVEDHPLAYASFEGTIPPRQYGAGRVIVWDHGTWEAQGDPQQGLHDGKLVFRLHGEKLAGLWELVRIAKPGDKQDAWLLFKKRDAWARPRADYDVTSALPDSVIERPLGALEAREPREAGAAPAALIPADLPAALPAIPALPGAQKARLPDTLAPQLATLAREPPRDGEWRYELKFDGYRLLARIDGRGAVRLFTRKGLDWTDKLLPLADAVRTLGLRSAWLDGEIVVLDDRGVPHFNRLQNAFDRRRTGDIVFFVFDLPFAAGHDLRAVPLHLRRAALRRVVESADGDDSDRIRFSAAFDGHPQQLLASVCELGLEGLIAKRADAPYESTRSTTWLKLKCQARQEFVIVGFTDRASARGEVGALLLAVHDDTGALQFAGSVGTGWDATTAAMLHRRLVAFESNTPPVDPNATRGGRWSRNTQPTRWVTPELVAEVAFAEWTPDHKVRHAVFHGLRADKPAREVTREPAPSTASTATRSRTVKPPAIQVTHPERVIDAKTGLTKLDLVRYYDSVAEWIVPHLKDRPVALVRAPDGIDGKTFFQKSNETTSIPGVKSLDPALWPDHAPLLTIHDEKSLLSAAQMNTIEFHTWNAKGRRLDRADRVIFDLDPGDGVPWPHVREAAQLVRTLLDELGLKSWLKTSGGRGLHVVVPLSARHGHDAVKDFAQAAVEHLARTVPQRLVAKSGARNRVGKIFVDYLRNAEGATTVAAFSARARPGLGVSMTLAWDELSAVKGADQWTIANARDHLSLRGADPWADYAGTRQTITAAVKVLARAG